MAVIFTVLAGFTGLTPRVAAQWVWCNDIWNGSKTDVEWTIKSEGGAIVGTWKLKASQRTLKGKIEGNSVVGEWAEQEQGGRVGTFVAAQSDNGHRMQITFSYQGQQIESSQWFCGRVPTEPAVETQVVTPSPDKAPQTATSAPTARPFPSASIFSPLFLGRHEDAHDSDNFQSFDKLPRVEQQKRLTKQGPRLPLANDMDDFSLRAFVKAGWPIVIDYALRSGARAELSISVEGSKPLVEKIGPTERNQLQIMIPKDFGEKPQVAKIRIVAFTDNNEPANFRLFGIAMGERAVQALWRINDIDSRLQIAFNNADSIQARDERSFHTSLFAVPQTGSALQIQVVPPTTIRPRQKPPLAFSVTSHSQFSNGRWELWHVDGFRWLEVWKKGTGQILPNKTKSGSWDGINSSKKVSLGTHAVQLTAWHGREADRAWVVARTDPSLIVIK